ncbi:autotransporter outer membrane beta-barrel domain-containing protein [Pseudomonas sp. P8_241]|uniref:autotransporter outer membrane beta-barrel domain-containing protein n=1 Tax=Pseudomonas sp. P8_241 TaxID=3043445 RepID=UPI002A36E40D|nr:autotransporter outer membrane beta-barrel domain-containing protein [Pseudomonas sp. P8_241]WPN44881.1 autotransporter outer membrane beta-barrel domain-containing protein [Pseudomonas sp. P8_241]
MEFSTDLTKYRYGACVFSLWLCAGWPQPALGACTLTPTVGNDSYVCDSGSSGALTDLSGNNSLAFPAGGSGTVTGNVTFGAGNDKVDMISGVIVGTVLQGDGDDTFTIGAGQVTGAVLQGDGVDNFLMSGGIIGSLAQGDSPDRFLMTGGTITGAFEDGDEARMTAGSIGRVDMKLDDNLFDMSGGEIKGNLVTGFGTDTIILSGGRIGGNLSVSGGNDRITVTGGEIVGEIRASAGNDTLKWSDGGTIRSAILMGEGNDRATLSNLTETTLALTPSINGENGTDLLTFDHSDSAGAGRYKNWETVNLNNDSRFDLDGTFVLGDSTIGTGEFNIDAKSTLTSVQGGIAPLNAERLATLNNAGTIDLTRSNSRTDDTMTLNGNYVGKGGQLLVQTRLGDDSSPSDKLVVSNGKLTGTTLITVTNIGGVGALTQQNGIEVVKAQGTAVSESTAFALKGTVSAGAYDYRLFKGGVTRGSENSFYLRSSVVAPPLVEVAGATPDSPPILVPLVAVPVAAPIVAQAGVPPSPEVPTVPTVPTDPTNPTIPTVPLLETLVLPAAVPGAAPIALFRQEVPVWSVLPPAATQLVLSALGTFHDRQGDQRLLAETGALSAGWGRVYGKDFDQTWAGTVAPRLNGSLKAFQVGNDLFASQLAGGQTQRTGFFVGHSRLQGNVNGFTQGFEDMRAGKVEINGDSLGAYWTLTDQQGWYFDSVAMYTWLDGDSKSERGLKIDNKGHALTFSVEGGYPIALTHNWVVEPQAQLINQKISLKSQNDGISRVSFDSDSAWTGRLGARLKGRYQLNGQPLEPYLRANLWHTFSGTDTVTFDNADKIESRQESSSADIGVGVVLSLNPSVSLYVAFDYTGNIDSNQQRGTFGNMGVRVSW